MDDELTRIGLEERCPGQMQQRAVDGQHYFVVEVRRLQQQTALRRARAWRIIDATGERQRLERMAWRLGQIDQGLAALTAATNLAGRNGEYQWAAELARLRGELLLLHAPPDETGAEAQFRAAIAIAQQQNAKSLELRATTSLARLLGHNGGSAEARRMLVTVYDWFTEGAETADLRAARNTLESLEKLPIGG